MRWHVVILYASVWTMTPATNSTYARPMGRSHPPLPSQAFSFRCQFEQDGEKIDIEVPISLASPMAAATLDQTIPLPGGLKPVRVLRYLPRAKYEQQALATEADGRRAIQISIDGAKQALQRWLIAGDWDHNRLLSLIGTWRYMAVGDTKQRDELFKQFKNERTRTPTLIVGHTDGSVRRTIPLKINERQHLAELGCTVRVKAFFPHFVMDKTTKEPSNGSDDLVNPAAHVQIEHAGRTESRWVFARFPDFKKGQSTDLPFRIKLDSPVKRRRIIPDFAVVTIGGKTHEVWTQHEGKVDSKRVKPGDRTDVPSSRYTFHIAKFLPSARLHEQYIPSPEKGARTVLQIETSDGSGAKTSLWLVSGEPRVIRLDGRTVTVGFGTQTFQPATQTAPAHGR